MLPRACLSRSLQLLLRSPASLQQSSGAAVASLQRWLATEGQHAAPSSPAIQSGLHTSTSPHNTFGARCFAAQAGPGGHSSPGHRAGPGAATTDLGEAASNVDEQDTDEGPSEDEPADEDPRAAAQRAEAEALAADPTSALTPLEFEELLRAGQPDEVIMRMAQRMGSILQDANFEDSLNAPTEEEEQRAQRRAREQALQEQQSLRVPVIDGQGRAYGTGKRKCSVARVWIKPGSGRMTINGRALDAYFGLMQRRLDVLAPMHATGTLGAFDTYATVAGGGVTGQAQALRHGISKALQAMDPVHKSALRSEGLLTRDNRVVERKKPGKPKARKSFQWVKR